MKNNKGMTLVEIIISIALIAIVLLFLFMLLVTVNDINTESEVNSSYLINKSLILKNIEEDLDNDDIQSIKLDDCQITNFYTSYVVPSENKYKVNQCLSLTYYNSTTQNSSTQIGEPAYIGIYYYQNKSSYVISYIHGTVKATRLLNKFEDFNVDKDNNWSNDRKERFKIEYTNANNVSRKYDNLISGTTEGLHKITIPIIGPDEKDYSILISYYGRVTV